MRKIYFLLLSAIIFSIVPYSLNAQSLRERLEAIPQVKKVEPMATNQFKEKYVLYFEQPLDHEDTSAGTFLQRVFVCHKDYDSATVVVTEGYGAQYATHPLYREELSKIFYTNNVVIEHRYFLESNPFQDAKSLEEMNWDYLDAVNAARDHHEVVKALKSIYNKKWIATGISKGGQTCGIYRAYFPDDVDITVPYVAPLCRAQEDGRHEPYLADVVGTPEEREKVKNFQIEFLKRRENIQPLFDSLCKAEGYQFNLPLDEIYDYCMYEFSFAFWQWGSPAEDIPGSDASDREVFNYMMAIASPSYFIKECDTSPFFIQAARELGYYGYDAKQFKKYKKYLRVKNPKGYLQKLFLPQTGEKMEFDPYIYKKVSGFLKNTDAKMLYIYGHDDPWSAPRVSDPHKENIKIFMCPGGCHATRINSFPEETREEIKSILKDWLYNNN